MGACTFVRSDYEREGEEEKEEEREREREREREKGERELTMPPHQSISRLVRESLAVVTNIFNESRTRNGGGDLRSLGVWLRKAI